MSFGWLVEKRMRISGTARATMRSRAAKLVSVVGNGFIGIDVLSEQRHLLISALLQVVYLLKNAAYIA